MKINLCNTRYTYYRKDFVGKAYTPATIKGMAGMIFKAVPNINRISILENNHPWILKIEVPLAFLADVQEFVGNAFFALPSNLRVTVVEKK